MTKTIKFSNLEESDLIVDAIYKGGSSGNAGDDPIHKLLKCGVSGGFRKSRGDQEDLEYRYTVLYSSLSNPDWPDRIEERTGQFVYYGDNKEPGNQLHDTPKGGNELLKECFNKVHEGNRENVPPFFIFTKGPEGRDVVFRGLAVPGAPDIRPTEDLVAVWKSKEGRRFQNYKAVFTILDIPVITREWIKDLNKGKTPSDNSPESWRKWVEEGTYTPLKAEKAVNFRTKSEQLPSESSTKEIVKTIYDHYKNDPYKFEKCAAELVKLMDGNVVSCDLTRHWMDGGRDAIGKYQIGFKGSSITVDFAIEAKCYKMNNSVGVSQTSRLISRLKKRQFGVLVTTSFVNKQAYKEIREDEHPVIIISAKDIVEILREAGLNSKPSIESWLESF